MAKKRKSGFEAVKQQYVVTYNRIKESNVDGFLDVMKTRDHEQADTFLILRPFKIARRDPFKKCTVYSPDTDVFLLLIHFYPSLPQSLLFHTGKGKYARNIDIGSSYEGIASSHVQVLLGFRVFTSCNQTESFPGNSKPFWWKKFQRALLLLFISS